MKEGRCAHCNKDGKLSEDHIIPKWLQKRMIFFGVRNNLGKKNIQWLCRPCNNYKSGVPDFTHPIAQPLTSAIIRMIVDQKLTALRASLSPKDE